MYSNYICTKINFKTMRQHNKTCKECNAPFTSKRSDAKYCSGACKQYFCLKNRGKNPNVQELTQIVATLKSLINCYQKSESMISPYLPAELKKMFHDLGNISRTLVTPTENI
jgi:hypothetical protein